MSEHAILENGHATVAGCITVYNYGAITGELIGQSDEYIPVGVGLPAFSTDINAPEANAGYVAVFDGSSWTVKTDMRGTVVYSISDRVQSTVDYIGPVRDGYVTIAPGSVFDEWDGSEWVLNESAKNAAEKQAAERLRQQLLANADAVTADWRTELALGEISDTDKASLSAWMAYKRDVKAVKGDVAITDGFAWPTKPE